LLLLGENADALQTIPMEIEAINAACASFGAHGEIINLEPEDCGKKDPVLTTVWYLGLLLTHKFKKEYIPLKFPTS